MSTIDELQSRLTAAMDRIAAAAAATEPQSGEDTAALQAALEDEKLANAQLTERVKKLSEQQQSAMKEAAAQIEAATDRMAALDLQLQRMSAANAQLLDASEALRTANAEGVGDPHLINKAMLAELETLRAARAADVAEATTILEALTPLVNGAEAQGGDHA